MKHNPKILICPLDWGIGHATRDVPVIRELLKQGAEVVIGADKRPLAFLKKEFPDLRFVKFPGYEVNYPENGSMVLKMAAAVPHILKEIKREHKYLDELIDEIEPDGVISDNRFGLWTKRVPTIFITHQIMIKAPPILEPVLYRMNLSYIRKYDECWIPDTENGESFTGDLAHKYSLPENASFIGLLSRFADNSNIEDNYTQDKNYKSDILVMLSGPEPQRTVLENIIIKQAKNSEYSFVILKGKTEESVVLKNDGRIKLFSHIETIELKKYMQNTDLVITRAGYSTIMDLAALGIKAVLIPTPGQTEQEYIARRFHNNGVYYSVSHDEFNLEKSVEASKNYQGIRLVSDNLILRQRIEHFFDR